MTPERDFDTYLSRRLAPLRPLLSYGRSAKAYPPTKAATAVYCWWRDLCLCFFSYEMKSSTPLLVTIEPSAIVDFHILCDGVDNISVFSNLKNM